MLLILHVIIQEVKKDLGNWLKTWRWHPRAVKSQLVVAGHCDHLFYYYYITFFYFCF